ncbi:SGNH/GDSL hydrolase family protein [Microbacterium sp.]|uniref:SGNH/GDSL hydrolase family protein n=1 Tax=Microbacterium sp. TaxID=51671 RepID=UPI00260FE765|nr:SGNH/GDSL hydrolase family protein [Microbacterium sp.]
MALGMTKRNTRVTALIVALTAAVTAVTLGVWRPWAPEVTEAQALAAEETAAVAPAPLVLPENPLVLVFGDSWTYGSAASEPTRGYAYLLADLIDGETVVDGIRASGYLRPGYDGPSYGDRIDKLDPTLDPDLVIIQGSINDRKLGVVGYRDAVTSAWDTLAETYDEATIVVLGPAPHKLPVDAGTRRVDHDLTELAADRGWWYISPVAERWITMQNYLQVIDVDPGKRHPSNAGHRYLAEKLASALAELAAAPVTDAGGTELDSSEPDPDQ